VPAGGGLDVTLLTDRAGRDALGVRVRPLQAVTGLPLAGDAVA
jgi:hypothetical protein